MNFLYIHHNGVLVGKVSHDSQNSSYSFKYDKRWKSEGFEISPSLGFNGFDDNAIKNFIENLLPEGKGLEELSVYLQISKSNKFAILKEIGFDTSGALTFSEDEMYTPYETSFREISDQELEEKVNNMQIEPIHIWDSKPRLSVAGVQAKLPIVIIEGVMGLGEGEISSTHILKFNKSGENVTLNEYISMKLAKELGFNVADVELKKIGREDVLFVERFDRSIVDIKHVKKMHIIDSVQALGLPVSFKYEKNLGKNMPTIRLGVSYIKLFSLGKKAIVPVLFKEQIIKWSIINILLGNSDAHGKNISFFVKKEGIEVAPFYDLVNVTMYNNYEQDIAMAIDDEFHFCDLKEYDFKEFFEANKISTLLYFDELKSAVKRLEVLFKDMGFISDELLNENREFVETYIENIIARVNKISGVLNSVRFVLPFEGQSDEEFYNESFQEIKKILGKSYDDKDSKREIVKRYLHKLKSRMIPLLSMVD